ncbi:LytR/AlgR family response regulator transcription factor [Tenacibaculum jejuense]|uniref:Two-component system response regulator containing LytTR DNA-binding domain n=1 Tax=Tenacibaculum jejuense TaxID=584609 RepID=A0A238UE94_9FLAO|nr:LytTR family DNA-binding domain-containing protein [Tenacibaculum jejuense]SNR16730.1 Two-component system response regulator containing LytTR DNA-binding domain [Tenacibaculum jejuense]
MDIKYITVDNQKVARTRIEKLLNNYHSFQSVGSFSNGAEAIDHINYLNPDVVFLDIQVEDMSGFDIIERTSPSTRPLFVFITEDGGFAHKAFDYLAFDYIVKPFSDNRIHQSINNIINHKKKDELLNIQSSIKDILSLIQQKEISENKKINIKSGNKILFIETDTIKHISASGYYVEIFTTDNKMHLLRESLSSLIRRLNSPKFMRIHRSTIINSDFIEEIIVSNYGETDVKITGVKTTFRVSKGYKKEFQELIGIK